jgi:ABC-type transporter Mla subunit MlaD
MADEAATLAGLSKLLARTRSERAQLIRAFDRALQLFDAAAEGSPEQVQALAQMVSLESKISEADLQLHNVLSHADLTKP